MYISFHQRLFAPGTECSNSAYTVASCMQLGLVREGLGNIQVNSSSLSLPWEMILIEQVADSFFASSEFLLVAAFLSAQLCEELNICLGLEGLPQLLLSSFLNRPNSFQFCLSPDSLCSVSVRQVTQHLLKLNRWNECLETIRKEICGTDPS